jgi:hypothetical protein
VLAGPLAACASLGHITREYGTANRDGTVTLPDGRTFWAWEHKSKPRLLLTYDPGHAFAAGAVAGLTFGAMRSETPPPIWEEAARQWFVERGRSQCRTTRGYPIETVYYEFEYRC